MAIKREAQEHKLPENSSAVDSDGKLAEEEEKRQKAIKRHTDIRRAFAWPLHRVPLEKHLANRRIYQGKAKLILPRSYRSGDGADSKFVRPDEDLNMVVFRWYDEHIEGGADEACGRVNFVAKDGVVSRRHEYLGPDPRVAGYELGSGGEICIRWWDGFLEDQWVGRGKWNVEVQHDAQGEWVEVE